MGRKIPAKKHRGVKDPLVQQAKRLASLKGKINAPPKDPDEQPVPRSLTRLFAFQDQDRKKSITKKNQHTRQLIHNTDNGANRPAHNPISQLRKLPGESGRAFSLRINSAVRALHNPAEDVDYPVDTEANDVKGLRMCEQRERRARKRRSAARGGRGARADGLDTHLTRTQKLALKKKAKKIKATEEVSRDRQEVVYERVSFGEVSHAPPALHFKRTDGAGAPRPGRRELLLNKLLEQHAAPPAELRRRETARHDALADLRRRERARQEAVAAYRALKTAKHKTK